MGDAEVKDQTPAPGLRLEIVPNLHIAAPVGEPIRKKAESFRQRNQSPQKEPDYRNAKRM
jgi:hypothetical protein